MNQKQYPLRLCGVTRSPIWGGTRLLQDWNKKSNEKTVGESWELAVRRDAVCTVTNGALCGRTLTELIAQNPRKILGEGIACEPFPLLVKLIDAHDRLSVQVHPDDAYAARVEGDLGKTEIWYIVDAEPGARIVMGLADGVDCARFAELVETGETEAGLADVEVHAGECYFIPAGMPHAIGKGILIAEIQQNCDLTYRLYDYGRRQADGTLRELHVKKALDVIRPFSVEEVRALQYERMQSGEAQDSLLAACRYFTLERIVLDDGAVRRLSGGRMRHLLCLAGEGRILSEGVEYPVVRGDSYLLPAALDEVELRGSMTLLASSLPDPDRLV